MVSAATTKAAPVASFQLSLTSATVDQAATLLSSDVDSGMSLLVCGGCSSTTSTSSSDLLTPDSLRSTDPVEVRAQAGVSKYTDQRGATYGHTWRLQVKATVDLVCSLYR